MDLVDTLQSPDFDFTREDAIQAGLILILPAAAMTILHAATTYDVRANYFFYYHDPAPWSVWTAAFLHHDLGHLVGNLFGYSLAIPLAYALMAVAYGRRRFWELYLSILVIAPPVILFLDFSLLHLVWEATDNESKKYGFSGVVFAYVGMLAAGTGSVVADRISRRAGWLLVYLIYLFAAGVLLFRHGSLSPFVFGIIALGAGWGGWAFRSEVGEPLTTASADLHGSSLVEYYTVLGSAVVIIALIVGGFPADTGGDEMTVNVISHAFGLLVGLLLTTGLLQYQRRFDR